MSVRIGEKTFNAEYLEPHQFQEGMQGRKQLDGCMVFKMGKGHHSFWMKGCIIPLDIIFVNNNRISRIHPGCQPSGNQLNPPRFTGIGDHVIEFPEGTSNGWKVGDRVSMYLGSPQNPVK
jgi:uncharacterized membrane protein (UPF0127 family)